MSVTGQSIIHVYNTFMDFFFKKFNENERLPVKMGTGICACPVHRVSSSQT